MTLKTLIVGYGRAGKRHAKLLREITKKAKIVAVDSEILDEDVKYADLKSALQDEKKVDIAIIATPPDNHLNSIDLCLSHNVKAIMCEKPLCGFGQLKRARTMQHIENVMISYNYRFHPSLLAGLTADRTQADAWLAFSDQYRPSLPKWSLLLDHLGHTFDSLSLLTGGLMLGNVAHYVSILHDGFRTGEVITVNGNTINGAPFTIIDCVRSQPFVKKAYIKGPMGELDFREPKDMFVKMWMAFFYAYGLKKPFVLNIKEALHAQELLEEANLKMIEKDISWNIPEF